MEAIPILAHERIRELAQIGLMAARRCDTQTAEVIFSAIEQSHPQRSMAYAGQALARLAVGRTADALRAVDRGLRLAQAADHPELHTWRSVVLLAAGRQQESAAALRQAGGHPLAVAMEDYRPRTLVESIGAARHADEGAAAQAAPAQPASAAPA